MKPKKQTNSKQVTARAAFFLLLILIIFVAVSTTSVYLGVKTGELDKKIIKPLVNTLGNYFISVVNSSNNQDTVNYESSSNSENNASSEAQIDQQVTVTPTPIRTRTIYIYPTYSPPKYTYPTPKPGDPGSPEWQAKFDKMQQDFDNSYIKMCRDNPSLPPCKQ